MPPRKQETITVAAHVMKLTHKAALLRMTTPDEQELWVPLSQIINADGLEEATLDSDPVDIEIAKWFCDKEGLS